MFTATAQDNSTQLELQITHSIQLFFIPPCLLSQPCFHQLLKKILLSLKITHSIQLFFIPPCLIEQTLLTPTAQENSTQLEVQITHSFNYFSFDLVIHSLIEQTLLTPTAQENSTQLEVQITHSIQLFFILP